MRVIHSNEDGGFYSYVVTAPICNESGLSGYRECRKKMVYAIARLETSY